MPAIDCTTPKDNLKVIPCLACLSESQLKKLLVVVMADLMSDYELPDDTAALLTDSACYTCMSKKQLLQVTVTIWATMAYGERQEMLTIEEMRAKIKCLLCASPAQVDAMLAQLTCGLIVWAT
jgi:hypothetical protein